MRQASETVAFACLMAVFVFVTWIVSDVIWYKQRAAMHLLVPICPDRSAPASAEGRDAYATGIDLELVPSISIRDRHGTARSVWRTCLRRHVFLIADEAEVPAASNLNAAPSMPAERGWAGGLDGGRSD